MPDTKQELNDSPQGEEKTTHDLPESAVSAVPTEDVAQGEAAEASEPKEVVSHEAETAPPDSIAAKIDEVIRQRRSRLPEVRGYGDAIEKFDSALRTVESTLVEALEDPSIGAEVQPLLEEFYAVAPLAKIADMRQAMSIVRSRFERGTINIGVSGQARVGKSTLLQSLSGLGDQQIPTGEGLPVTAVRSRIEHSNQNIALVKFHDWSSFRREVLKPFYSEIDLGPAPSTPEAFLESSPGEDVDTESKTSRQLAMLEDLRLAQATFEQYRSLLSGQEERKPLDQISDFVRKTYSTDNKPANTKYLAVREVRILCSFPSNDVHRLVLVDLPGLGEISPEAEDRHLIGLKKDTDLVVMVKRPDSSQACDWGEKDAQALDLVEAARGELKRTSDFLFILKNQSPDDNPSLVKALALALETKVNTPRTHDRLTILSADVKTRESALNGVLQPVLSHLADRLALMDAEVLAGAVEKVSESAASLSSLLSKLRNRMKSIGGTEDNFHVVVTRAGNMHADLAMELEDKVVDFHFKRARDLVEDDEYIERVNEIYTTMMENLGSGFRADREEWVKYIYKNNKKNRNTSGIAGEEINRIRVEISRRFTDLDIYFRERVDGMINHIAQIVTDNTGELLVAYKGREALQYLKELADGAGLPAKGLSEALSELLALKIEYKTHLHPNARKELDILQLEQDNPDDPSGDKVLVASGGMSAGGAEKVASRLVELGRQAAAQVRKALLGEVILPELVLHAAAEQFVDATIRSGDSGKEFREIVRAYFADIYPDESEGLKARSVRSARLEKALKDADACSSKLTNGGK